MDAFTKLTGVVAPIDRVNIDSDQIIPAVYLKSIERSGFEDALFSSWRYNADGSDNPDFILNKEGYRNANVLVCLSYISDASDDMHFVHLSRPRILNKNILVFPLSV